MTNRTPSATGPEDPSVVVKSWPHGPRSVGAARRLLVSSLDGWGLAHLADEAELVVSELVTNSVRHGGAPRGRRIATRFERVEGGVRIEVHDANELAPVVREASADAEGGRGLALVDAITAGRWGVASREGVGKMVWALCVSPT